MDKNGVISFENLKRIAGELGEVMSDEELKLMIYEANKSSKYIYIFFIFSLFS